jgi:molybdopterin-guanine dinucleotide biosynthesis protein A
MGADKALLAFHGDTPLVCTLVEVLGTVCDELLLVGGDPHRFDTLGLAARCASDATVGLGPLAGVLGALRAMRHQHCLVVGCDMPFVTPAVVAALAREPRDYRVLAYPGPGDLEPLLAVYSRDCEQVLTEMLEAGALRARDALHRLGARGLASEVVRLVDPQGLAAVNVNSPHEVAIARRAFRSAC